MTSSPSAAVSAAGLEDFDVLGYHLNGLSSCFEFPVMHQFIFSMYCRNFPSARYAKAGFALPAIATARRRCRRAKLFQQLAVIMRAILAAAIRVENQPLLGLSINASEQCLHDELFRHPGAGGVAHQFTIEQVFQTRQI